MDLVSFILAGKRRLDLLRQPFSNLQKQMFFFFILSPVTTSAVRQETDSCPGEMKAFTLALSALCSEGGQMNKPIDGLS